MLAGLALLATEPRAEGVAYVGATLVDPGAGTVTSDGVVIVEGSTIRAVGLRDDIVIPRGVRMVRLENKWLLPGYVDVHTHLSGQGTSLDNADFFGAAAPESGAAALANSRERVARTLARHLRSGTTTIVDVGGVPWTVEERDNATATKPAPRIFASGPIIGPARDESVYGKERAGFSGIASAAAGREAVRQVAALRPDLIKFYMVPAEHTGRPFSEIRPWFEAAIDEARRLGFRTTAHAMRFPIANAAVDIGIDSLAHGILDIQADDAFLDRLRQRSVVVAPTLMVLQGPISVMNGNPVFTEPELKWGDPFAIADLLGAADRRRLEPRDAAFEASQNRRAVLNQKALGVAQANAQRLQQAGAPIAVGTDAGLLGILHGPSIFHEFDLMRASGIEPLDILAAATIGGARFLGRQAEFGSLAVGMRADLVILDADPVADIRNAGRVHLVVAGGQAWQPEEALPPDAAETLQQRLNALHVGRTDLLAHFYAEDARVMRLPAEQLLSGARAIVAELSAATTGRPQLLERRRVGERWLERVRWHADATTDSHETTRLYEFRAGRIQFEWRLDP